MSNKQLVFLTWKDKKGKILARIPADCDDEIEQMEWNPPDEDFEVWRETFVLSKSKKIDDSEDHDDIL